MGFQTPLNKNIIFLLSNMFSWLFVPTNFIRVLEWKQGNIFHPTCSDNIILKFNFQLI